MSQAALRSIIGAALLVAFVLLPFAGLSDYWTYTVTIGFYYALLAASWSLLVGYVGRISFAQAAMSGLGGYASALGVLEFGLPIGLGLVFAALIAGLVGYVLGWLTLRLHGAYLGLTTIAFGEILRISVTAEHWLTEGSLGLQVPPLIPGGSRLEYYYIFLAITVGCLAAMGLLLRSRIGLFFQSIREDEDGAASLGVAVTTWKCVAFAISSAFAGLAGGLYAHFVQLIAPSMMSLQEMGVILAMAVIGGFHNILYAALGGMLLQVLLEALREVEQWRLVVFGLVTILVLRFAPNGLFGMLSNIFVRRRNSDG
ncbi:high-affinity branched-chain amino acid ABC transporter, permease protein [Fulvimarina pelagi HTCC2506]|uniref:High-affinity branched-chain amino acid ABC transporter, permease protein n=1 Tax=Fulvimarina pelagi HTCC2506 TaxID=314231 RepID=Q0FY61_9HYPH|nr:branched-chain amino acid ABC transporter permease [Fulvimarina pelagi]EAU39881.1 high-affinity branched-chain amino acid ABC transporter, permease protein [Fulvimarina pelagi HTCC2506]